MTEVSVARTDVEMRGAHCEQISQAAVGTWPSPLPRIGALLGFFGALSLALTQVIDPVEWLSEHSAFNPVLVVGFLMNLAVFLALWSIYFLSPRRYPFRSRSLRTLLRSETTPWISDSAFEEQESTRERGNATLTAQAIFIAISVLIINMVADRAAILRPDHPDVVERAAATGALGAAALAFILILISVDATDTTFNSFTNRGPAIVSYFFKLSSTLKYYGFVLSFLSLVLLVFTVSPAVGSIALACFVGFGYTYWFPDIERTRSFRIEVRLFRTIVAAANIAMLIHAS